MTEKVPCPRCKGSGYDPTYSGSSQGSPSCQRCNGKGKVSVFYAAEQAAWAIVRSRPDYWVGRAHQVGEGDAIRLVPSDAYRVPFALAQPLVVVMTTGDENEYTLMVRPRAVVVSNILKGVGLDRNIRDLSEHAEDFLQSVVYPADYPVLIRH